MDGNAKISNILIKRALRVFGLPESDEAVCIRETDYNAVYLVGKQAHKVLRIGKKIKPEDLNFEINLLNYLGSNRFPVARVYPTLNNKPFAVVDGVVVTLFKYIKGNHIKINSTKKPKLIFVKEAAKTLGKLHSLTIGCKPNEVRSRTIFTEFNRILQNKESFCNYFENAELFIKEIKNVIKLTENQKVKLGVINNDYRIDNVIFGENGKVSAVVDFDWACSGPLVKDLALALAEWSFPDGADKPWADIFDTFLKSYNENSPQKWKFEEELRSWMMFSCLSEACTYFADLMDDPNNTKRVLKSYMYKKYHFFKDIRLK